MTLVKVNKDDYGRREIGTEMLTTTATKIKDGKK
jgi:hypothetical protein